MRRCLAPGQKTPARLTGLKRSCPNPELRAASTTWRSCATRAPESVGQVAVEGAHLERLRQPGLAGLSFPDGQVEHPEDIPYAELGLTSQTRPEDVLKVDCDEDGVGGEDAADALRSLVATKARCAL